MLLASLWGMSNGAGGAAGAGAGPPSYTPPPFDFSFYL